MLRPDESVSSGPLRFYSFQRITSLHLSALHVLSHLIPQSSQRPSNNPVFKSGPNSGYDRCHAGTLISNLCQFIRDNILTLSECLVVQNHVPSTIAFDQRCLALLDVTPSWYFRMPTNDLTRVGQTLRLNEVYLRKAARQAAHNFTQAQ